MYNVYLVYGGIWVRQQGQARDALLLAKLYEEKSQIDLMTEIYNNISFKHQVINHMKVYDCGNLYLFDLDHFKLVNDTYGRQEAGAADLLLV